MSVKRFGLPVFCAGLLAGILVMSIGKGIFLDNTGFFDADTLYQIKDMTVDRGALFYYVLGRRLAALFVMAALVTTYLGLAACFGGMFWGGMSLGSFVSALMLRYGLKGLLLAAVCLLPQYLVYVPAWLAFLKWGEAVYRGIYSRNNSVLRAEDKSFILQKSGQLIAIAAAFAIGCLLEAHINSPLLCGYLHIF